MMIDWNSNEDPVYGAFTNKKFCDIYPDIETWMQSLDEIAIKPDLNKEELTTIYYLLYSRYGNSTIAPSDENRFRYRVVEIIYSKGPSWAKKLEIQSKLRHLTEDELQRGGKMIVNQALNPSQQPSTGSLEELEQINQQSTSNQKKSRVEAYMSLYDVLEDDITEYFLSSFKKLFISILMPEQITVYEED